jgi:hypothetical protein
MVAVAAAPSGAALLPTNEFCSGAGNMTETDITPGGPTFWQITGSGFCGRANFPVLGLETVKIAGAGVSDSQGLCSNTLLVTNLILLVKADFKPVATSPAAHTTFEIWSSPISFFPLVTPVLVSPATDPTSIGGAGLMFSHIFLQCGNGGNRPSVQFDWAQLF